MEVKAVFFDIDGTLVNDRKSVLKSTKDAIRIVKDQGVLVGVATGRGPFFVKDLMEDLDLDFAVTYNGQYIFNKDRVLFTSPLSKSHLRQLITYAKKEGKEIALGTKDAMLGSKIMSFGLGSFSQRVSRFVPSMLTRTVSHSFNRMVSKIVPQKEEDLLHLMNQPIYQVLMLMTPEESEKAAADFKDLKLTRSNPFAADVINQGNSKLEGIRRVGKEYGFDLNQVMAFGDSDNDLEMLAGVGMSVAMGNGSSSVKEVAKHITTSNQQDGIHKALEHFGVLASEKVFVSRDYHFNKVKTFHHMMDERTQEEPRAWDLKGATHRAKCFATNPSFSSYAVVGGRSASGNGCRGRRKVYRSKVVLGIFVHHTFVKQLFKTAIAVKCGELFHVVAVQLVDGDAHNKSGDGRVRLCLAFNVGKCGQRKEGYVFVHAL